MDREPKSGELYRHFKNRLYQVIAVAEHSETAEKLVIYQALYGDYQVYARPLEMFTGEVDHAKYPQVRQRYRFERVERSTLSEKEPAQAERPAAGRSEIGRNAAGTGESGRAAEAALTNACGAMETVDAKLMAFLDTDDWEMKYNIVVSMRDEITDHMINNLAVSIDVVIPEGDLSDRYEALKSCIRTKQRYESDRMR